MNVIWSARALAAWRVLDMKTAEAVARVVDDFSRGSVTAYFLNGEYHLYVDGLTIVVLIDGDTLHVWHIRH
jgi:hypothetical protein